MHNPDQWPPSSLIHPLFVAFHINSSAKDSFITTESLEYLRKHQPIGCRDIQTQILLSENGIDSYFSGCMTLTLGENFHDEEKNEIVYFVDPYFPYRVDILSIMKNSVYTLFHLRPILKIAKNYPHPRKGWIKMIKVGAFYRIYKKKFDDKLLQNAKYITQQSYYYNENFNSNEDLLEEAERLVNNYAKAKLVVTSRIHCALPCLGLETPVIYVNNAQAKQRSTCRLDGLRELFNVITLDNERFIDCFSTDTIISSSTSVNNSKEWQKLARDLVSRCKSFIISE